MTKKRYKCPYKDCKRTFGYSSHLTDHIRSSHTFEKPYKCKYCPKQFCRSGDRSRHERTHTGEKPYKCKYCPKAFNNPGHRKDHELNHVVKHPFPCKFCPRRFPTCSHRNRHQILWCTSNPNRMKKLHSCHKCSKRFSTTHEVKRHEDKCSDNGYQRSTTGEKSEKVFSELVMRYYRSLSSNSKKSFRNLLIKYRFEHNLSYQTEEYPTEKLITTRHRDRYQLDFLVPNLKTFRITKVEIKTKSREFSVTGPQADLICSDDDAQVIAVNKEHQLYRVFGLKETLQPLMKLTTSHPQICISYHLCPSDFFVQRTSIENIINPKKRIRESEEIKVGKVRKIDNREGLEENVKKNEVESPKRVDPSGHQIKEEIPLDINDNKKNLFEYSKDSFSDLCFRKPESQIKKLTQEEIKNWVSEWGISKKK